MERAEAQQLQQIQAGGDRVAGAISGALGGISGGLKAREQRQSQAEQQQFENQMATRGMELEEAKEGFVREEPGEQTTKTPEELARLQEQGEKPVEIGTQGPARPGVQEPGAAEGKLKPRAPSYEAQTKRMNAEAARLNAENSYKSARNKGNTGGMESAVKSMQSGMEITRKQIDDVVRGEVNPEAVLQAYSDNPDAQQALESGDPAQMAQTAKRIAESQLAYQNISYMAATGMPPLDRMDSNPIWQRYAQNEIALTAAFKNGMPLNSPNQAFQGAASEQMPSAMQAWQGVQSLEEGQRFIRKLTAKTMLNINEAERMAGQMAQATRETEERVQLEQQNVQLQQQIMQMQQSMAEQGFTEEGQTLEEQGLTETKELPGGEQVESGMGFRGQQYQPPGREPESFTSGSRGRPKPPRSKYGSSSK
jgi:hypothetical protein